VRRVRAQTGSNRRAFGYVVNLVGRNLDRMRRYLAHSAIASHWQRDTADLAEQLGQGDPSLGIRLSGGVGDYIVIARFLRDMLAATPNAAFDIYCSSPASAAWVFAQMPGFRAAYHDILFDRYIAFYDLAMRISQFVLVHGETVNWPKLRRYPALTRMVDSILRSRGDLELIIQRHPYLDNYLATLAVFRNRTRRDFLHGMAKLPYGGDRLDLPADHLCPQRLGLVGRPYVVVHNGFDPNFVITASAATKCYPHFGAVITALRQHVPGVVFIQVGSSTSIPIQEADIDLLGKTTLPEVAGLIAGASLLLDNEGGLVHVAACLGTTSCVVFGPTPSRFFGYPDNINVDPLFCGGCWWVTETWMDICARGFRTARCMTEQPPDHIAARAAPVLARRTRVLAAD
jgi:ADP-heptose:LPS heptosyltransferase